MANWSKRTSRKLGSNTKSRITTTTTSKGGSTRSISKKIGNVGPRITESIKNENGKVVHKVYTTEYHPILGTKRTSRTVYASSNAKPKKPKKIKTTHPQKYVNKASTYVPNPTPTPRDWVKHPRGSMWYDDHIFPRWSHWAFWGGMALVVIILAF